jgi:glutathione S-transferase
MQRILWGRSTSSNVMKAIWVLEELGLPYDRRDVGGKYGQTDTQAYRAMNPTGLVPTLQEGDFALWESNAVCRYLCRTYAPESPLWPQDQQLRARVDQWMDAQQTQLNRPMSVVFWGLVRTPPEQRDAAAIAQGVAATAKVFGLIGTGLTRHAFVAGEDFTLADVPWGVHVHRWFTMEFDRPEVPGLRAWYDRLLSRPAYRAHVARPLE